jgi:hypothetical protein
MFIRKKTKLRIAYGLLAVTALSVVAYDAEVRTQQSFHNTSTEAERAMMRRPAAPLPILPLAQSPFAEARPSLVAANRVEPARNKPAPSMAEDGITATSGILFLKSAMQVDLGDGPIAFPRGTRVQFVRQQDGKLLVSHDGANFLVEKSQVTDDMAKLGVLARNSS